MLRDGYPAGVGGTGRKPLGSRNWKSPEMIDRSNGYEGVAAEFLAGRGRAPSTAVGTRDVRHWARTLPRKAAVIDLGCGSGLPITKVLVSKVINAYASDASSSFVKAFQQKLPDVPVACESVEDSLF